MRQDQRCIDIRELPESATSDLASGDTQVDPAMAADIKGGVQVGKNAGIRPLREIRKVSSSSGDPGI